LLVIIKMWITFILCGQNKKKKIGKSVVKFLFYIFNAGLLEYADELL
jgi:hypothetical protein